jgi:adenylyltransferase/sulfurtransferase
MTPPPQHPRDLTPAERERYQRHLVLPEFGEAGQQALASGSVLLVGAGGLGTPAALYLAAAGVGRIGLVDDDRVEVSNLQRQVIYAEHDVGKFKVDVTADRLRAMNSMIQVEALRHRFDNEHAVELLSRYDLILDGTDNFASRWLIGDGCYFSHKPLLQGSVLRFMGQVALFDAASGPCHRCLFAEPPAPESAPDCAEAGVLGVLPGTIGLLMATEALKWLAGIGQPLAGKLIRFDALRLQFQTIAVPPDPACPLCSPVATITALEPIATSCPTAAQDPSGAWQAIGARRLAERLSSQSPPLVLDVREPWEWELGHIQGAKLIPIQQLADRLTELDSERETVVYCKVGARSAWACDLLIARGFRQVSNLEGGILAWSAEVADLAE